MRLLGSETGCDDQPEIEMAINIELLCNTGLCTVWFIVRSLIFIYVPFHVLELNYCRVHPIVGNRV